MNGKAGLWNVVISFILAVLMIGMAIKEQTLFFIILTAIAVISAIIVTIAYIAERRKDDK